MKYLLKINAGMILLFLSSAAWAGQSQNYQVNEYVINAAGGNMASNVHTMNSSVGEGVIGAMTNGALTFISGFLKTLDLTEEELDLISATLPEDRRAWAVRNKFNPKNGESTFVQFRVEEAAARVTIKIYNLRGEYIKTLVDQDYTTGEWSKPWYGLNRKDSMVASGIYLISVKIGRHHKILKAAVIKK